jgi:hypothetical protein
VGRYAGYGRRFVRLDRLQDSRGQSRRHPPTTGQVAYCDYSFHLCEQANKESKVSAVNRITAATTSGTGRGVGKHKPTGAHRCSNRTGMSESLNAETGGRNRCGRELRVPCNAFLNAWHTNEDHAKSAFIEDRAQLFKAVHGQAICFIDHDQGGGVWNRFHSDLVLVEYLEVGGLRGGGWFGL